MNWQELLSQEIKSTYKVTAQLMDMVGEDELEWKPATGSNWMTVGQLLMHLTNACGSAMKGFVTGDWGMPADFDWSTLTPEEMLPPAEKLPTVSSVADAKRLLAEDEKLSYDMLKLCDENRLNTQNAPAPWDSTPTILGYRLLQMVQHFNQHKGQLFYYLKLQGKPVNTGNLYGM